MHKYFKYNNGKCQHIFSNANYSAYCKWSIWPNTFRIKILLHSLGARLSNYVSPPCTIAHVEAGAKRFVQNNTQLKINVRFFVCFFFLFSICHSMTRHVHYYIICTLFDSYLFVSNFLLILHSHWKQMLHHCCRCRWRCYRAVVAIHLSWADLSTHLNGIHYSWTMGKKRVSNVSATVLCSILCIIQWWMRESIVC